MGSGCSVSRSGAPWQSWFQKWFQEMVHGKVVLITSALVTRVKCVYSLSRPAGLPPTVRSKKTLSVTSGSA